MTNRIHPAIIVASCLVAQTVFGEDIPQKTAAVAPTMSTGVVPPVIVTDDGANYTLANGFVTAL